MIVVAFGSGEPSRIVELVVWSCLFTGCLVRRSQKNLTCYWPIVG